MKNMVWSELSKEIGWRRKRSMSTSWPRLGEINDDTPDEQIIIWHRFLPTPSCRYQIAIKLAVKSQYDKRKANQVNVKS